ncbi:MAG: hypothetical protein LBR38_02160 [Synergistaceae bacterium]|jgi:hypothetical protein|nr:hypothetical protein [Synergistaceae bacterium]
MPRKELGVSDAEWIAKRDACWIQNNWSAGITPKGAFFCEVAGTMDMLFDGPGGWPVEPGWWNREPKDFGSQLEWCEMCGGCLDVPQRLSCDGRDDVTPAMYERLKALGSPKALAGKVVVHDPAEFDASKYHTFTSGNEYMDAGGNQRFGEHNRNIYPKSFAVTPAAGLRKLLAGPSGVPDDWVIVSDDRAKAERAAKYIGGFIINPGCLYTYKGMSVFNVMARSLREALKHPEDFNSDVRSYYPRDKVVSFEFGAARIAVLDAARKVKRALRAALKKLR